MEENTPLTYKFEVSGCPYSHGHKLKKMMLAEDLYDTLFEVDQMMRNRMKHENISESEYAFLELLRHEIGETLYPVT